MSHLPSKPFSGRDEASSSSHYAKADLKNPWLSDRSLEKASHSVHPLSRSLQKRHSSTSRASRVKRYKTRHGGREPDILVTQKKSFGKVHETHTSSKSSYTASGSYRSVIRGMASRATSASTSPKGFKSKKSQRDTCQHGQCRVSSCHSPDCSPIQSSHHLRPPKTHHTRLTSSRISSGDPLVSQDSRFNKWKGYQEKAATTKSSCGRESSRSPFVRSAYLKRTSSRHRLGQDTFGALKDSRETSSRRPRSTGVSERRLNEQCSVTQSGHSPGQKIARAFHPPPHHLGDKTRRPECSPSPSKSSSGPEVHLRWRQAPPCPSSNPALHLKRYANGPQGEPNVFREERRHVSTDRPAFWGFDYRPAPPRPPPFPFPVAKVYSRVHPVRPKMMLADATAQRHFTRRPVVEKCFSRKFIKSQPGDGVLRSHHVACGRPYTVPYTFKDSPLCDTSNVQNFSDGRQPFRKPFFDPCVYHEARGHQPSFSSPAASGTLEEGEIYDVSSEEHCISQGCPKLCLLSAPPVEETNKKNTVPVDTSGSTQHTTPCQISSTHGHKGSTHREEAWTIDSVTLSPTVLSQLAPTGLLDDAALEFFFRFLYHYVLSEDQRNGLFLFNSYFYTKLLDGGQDKKLRHFGVRRWTNRLLGVKEKSSSFFTDPKSHSTQDTSLLNDSVTSSSPGHPNATGHVRQPRQFIWEFDTVVIPIHNSAHHWTLTLVCYPYLALRPPQHRTTCKASQSGSDSCGDPKEPLQPVDVEANFPGKMPEKLPVCGVVHEDDKWCDPQVGVDSEEKKKQECVGLEDGCVVFKEQESQDQGIGSNEKEEASLKSHVKNPSLQSYIPPDIKRPAIFHLDSLQHTIRCPPHLKTIIVEYFQEEFHTRCPVLWKEGYRMADSKDWLFNPKVVVPHQANNYDCGVFLIEYLRYLFTQPERIQSLLYNAPYVNPTLKNVEKRVYTNPELSVWFHSNQISHRRTCLQKMLLFMLEHPDWKVSKQCIEYDAQLRTPLQIIVHLFNSTNPLDLLNPNLHVKKNATTQDSPSLNHQDTPTLNHELKMS